MEKLFKKWVFTITVTLTLIFGIGIGVNIGIHSMLTLTPFHAKIGSFEVHLGDGPNPFEEQSFRQVSHQQDLPTMELSR